MFWILKQSHLIFDAIYALEYWKGMH